MAKTDGELKEKKAFGHAPVETSLGSALADLAVVLWSSGADEARERSRLPVGQGVAERSRGLLADDGYGWVDVDAMERIDHRPTMFFAEGSEPAMLSIMFRCGVADEPPALRGITHLVEHLAMFAVGKREHHCNAFVDPLTCVFYARGTQEELERFGSDVLAALGDLPLDRLETERRVLEREAARDDSDVVGRLLSHRFGVVGFGGVEVAELGLNWVSSEEIAEWARERFTAANAVVWFQGPRPPALDVSLPAGQRLPAPSAEPLDGVPFPCWMAEGREGVAASGLVPRTWASMLGLEIAREQLHERLRLRDGLVYDIAGSYQALTADTAHAALIAGCRDEDAERVADELVATLRHPDPVELAEAVEAAKRKAIRGIREEQEHERELRLLDSVALDELLGASVRLVDDAVEKIEALGVEDVRAALDTFADSMLLVVPWGARVTIDGFAPYDRPVTEVDAPRVALAGRGRGSSAIRLGPAGVAYEEDGEQRVAIPADEVAAVVEGSGGKMYVYSIAGDRIEFEPDRLEDPEAARATVAELASGQVVPDGDQRAGVVKAAAAEHLEGRLAESAELAMLPDVLQAEERIEALAEAVVGIRTGLLAVTDRRLLFLHQSPGHEIFHDVALDDVEGVDGGRRLLGSRFRITLRDRVLEFESIKPRRQIDVVDAALRRPFEASLKEIAAQRG